MHLECTYCKLMQFISKCIYKGLINLVSNWNSAHLIVPQNSNFCWMCSIQELHWFGHQVDVFFWGVISSEPCYSQLLLGECSGLKRYQEQQTEAPKLLTLYMFTKLYTILFTTFTYSSCTSQVLHDVPYYPNLTLTNLLTEMCTHYYLNP